MKLPKDRKLNDYLLRQYKQQETRIRNCGLEILLGKIVLTEIGTYFTTRPKR